MAQEEMHFLFTVQESSVAGRADSDCVETFRGKTVKVVPLNRDKSIWQNDRLSIDYIKKSGSAMPEREAFSLSD